MKKTMAALAASGALLVAGPVQADALPADIPDECVPYVTPLEQDLSVSYATGNRLGSDLEQAYQTVRLQHEALYWKRWKIRRQAREIRHLRAELRKARH